MWHRVRVIALTLLSFLLLWLLLTVNFTWEHTPLSQPPPVQVEKHMVNHVLFVGDSLSRYLYLTTVYLLLQGRGPVPEAMVNQKLSPSWIHFFNYTLKMLNGSSTCDCLRPETKNDKQMLNFLRHRLVHENRQFRHPTVPLVVSYVQSFGDSQMFGMVPLDRLQDAKLLLEQIPHRLSASLNGFLRNDVKLIKPPVTHIVLNVGHWELQMKKLNTQAMLEDFSKIGFVSLWRESNPFKPGTWSAKNRPFPLRYDIAAKAMCKPVGPLGCSYAAFPFADIWTNKPLAPDYVDAYHFGDRVNVIWAKHVWGALRNASLVAGKQLIPVSLF